MTDITTLDLDTLMSYIAEINAKPVPLAPGDIDDLISLHRAARARKASGAKPSRAKVDLSQLLGVVAKPKPAAPVFTRKL